MKKKIRILFILGFAFMLVACREGEGAPAIDGTGVDAPIEEVPTDDEPDIVEIEPEVDENHNDVTSIDISENERIEFGGISWIVLYEEADQMLVISEEILELRQFNSTNVDVTWENSDLRQYLNDEFITNHFSAEEQSRLIETTVNNDHNPWLSSDTSASTIDRVFILSVDEVVRYFGDSGDLENRPLGWEWGIYDQYNRNRIAFANQSIDFSGVGDFFALERGSSSEWWLRTEAYNAGDKHDIELTLINYILGSHQTTIEGSDEGGIIDMYGVYSSKFLGVRPAMWIER